MHFFLQEQLVAFDVLICDEGFYRISHSLIPILSGTWVTFEEFLLHAARRLEGFSCAEICKLCSIRGVANWVFLAEFEQ